ncbi:MAG: acetyl-CoA C-acyltransferase [Acidimicrobiales bacterium]|jgi:acetyl-CoA C-acetyltransferase|nr:acetyl-CoA C-acyltransferase [Acidimicrobiales bacterium]
MSEAYIVDAVRSPMGRFRGGLSGIHPVDLGAEALRGLMDRVAVDPADVDDVIWGCVGQIGAQAFNVGRNCWLAAGFDDSVPAVTLDRQCGSSQQAVHFASQAIRSGDMDLVVAGGVEVMSLVTLNSQADVGPDLGMGYPFDADLWTGRFGEQVIHQFRGGNLIAEQWEISPGQMNQLALKSHQSATDAWSEGRFDSQFLEVNGVQRDEAIRETTIEKMESLSPFSEFGPLTAAMSSQLADGSAAILVASGEAVERYGLEPMARVHTAVVTGSDPVLILTGPIPATRKAIAKSGLSLDDIGLFECNEAFASVVLAWEKEIGVDPDLVNVNGGAIALGHPLGASGARLMTTLVHEMQRTGTKYGLQTMCEGGGLSNATILELV